MFTLKLSTEEIKTLQLLLEEKIVWLGDVPSAHFEKDLLAKITLAQLEDEEPKKDHGMPSFRMVPIF